MVKFISHGDFCIALHYSLVYKMFCYVFYFMDIFSFTGNPYIPCANTVTLYYFMLSFVLCKLFLSNQRFSVFKRIKKKEK